MFVLGGPSVYEDPCAAAWEFLGPVRGLPDRWAIDGTVFPLNGELYFAYSGWPLDRPGDSDLIQQLLIARMADPLTAASAPVTISHPGNPWEITTDGNGDHGINEGPQFLASPDGRWKGLVYSCAGSWTNQYKMAVLHYTGGDPLDPHSWIKANEPLLQTCPHHHDGPWGPGHGNFVNVNGETLAVFHATDAPTDGWENRRARVQRVVFSDYGPYMGAFVGPKQPEDDMGDIIEWIIQKIARACMGPDDTDGASLKALVEEKK